MLGGQDGQLAVGMQMGTAARTKVVCSTLSALSTQPVAVLKRARNENLAQGPRSDKSSLLRIAKSAMSLSLIARV